MRSISLNGRRALNAEQTGEIPVFLFTVTHEALAEPRRLSSDPTARLSEEPLRYGTVSRAEEYDFVPIGLVQPEDSDETPPAFRITIDNIMRELTPLLRSVATPPLVTVEMVRASEPDVVEVLWPEFDLVDSELSAEAVVLTLTVDALVTEPYPSGTFTPGGFAGLF
jgi:hypothetical protein